MIKISKTLPGGMKQQKLFFHDLKFSKEHCQNFPKYINFHWKRIGAESTQESSAFRQRILVAISSKTLCIKYLKIKWQRALSCNYILLKGSNSLSFPRGNS